MKLKNRFQKIIKIITEKETKNEYKSLSEFFVHILIVLIIVVFIFYFFQETMLFLFGEKVYVLVILGIGLIYFGKFIVLKISGIFWRRK